MFELPKFISELFEGNDNLLEQYLAAYAPLSRAYHNFDHIEDLFVLQEKHFSDMSYNGKVGIAFHDIFYLPGSPDNENNSWCIAASYMQMLNPPEVYDEVAIERIILATRHNNDPFNVRSAFLSEDEMTAAQVCDVDLAGLASSEEQYRVNANKVRSEFNNYSDEEWIKGRRKFIHSFLAKEQIFKTDVGLELWENNARRNMARELGEIGVY